MLHYKNVLSFSVILELFELIQPLMAEGLGWFCLAWRLTCSCFTFSRIRRHFKKSCLLHFNGQWKQDQLIFWAVINNKSWASWGTRMEMHQSVMSKTCLLCSLRICCTWIIFEIYLDALAWILFAKFGINFRNPLIGCQCFDFFYPKARSVHPNWRTRSNFVRPESRSVCPARNDVLWIQCWKCWKLINNPYKMFFSKERER